MQALRPTVTAVFALALAAPLQAQDPYLVKDIQPGPGSGTNWSSPRIDFNGSIVLSANDGVHGYEPWISDGTDAGTQLILDVNPGSDTSSSNSFTLFNGELYFLATTATHGRELWKTDGTAAGTTMVVDIDPGTGSGCSAIRVFGNSLLLRGDDGSLGRELWISDGTAAGTSLLVDINPGAGDGFTGAFALEDYNGFRYFGADDGTTGRELWRTDGTAAGTTLVADIEPGGTGTGPGSFAVSNGRLFFTAVTPGAGLEPWSTDGTAAGTTMLADIRPGPSHSIINTAALPGAVLIQANDGVHGEEMWITDGTPAGTQMLIETNPGPADGVVNNIPRAIGGLVYWAGTDPVFGQELWRSDGTLAGTFRLGELVPGPSHLFMQKFTDVDGKCFLMYDDTGPGWGAAYSNGELTHTWNVPNTDQFWNPRAWLLVDDLLYFDPAQSGIGLGSELYAIPIDLDGDGILTYFDDVNVVESCSCPVGSSPCGNPDPNAGCANSTGQGAKLAATGTTVLSADDLVLTTTQVGPNLNGILFMGTTAIAPLPLGDGLRCTGGTTFRFPFMSSGAAGTFVNGPGLAAQSATFPAGFQFLAGGSWTFQQWFRDPTGPCGSSSNLSSAISVTFTP